MAIALCAAIPRPPLRARTETAQIRKGRPKPPAAEQSQPCQDVPGKEMGRGGIGRRQGRRTGGSPRSGGQYREIFHNVKQKVSLALPHPPIPLFSAPLADRQDPGGSAGGLDLSELGDPLEDPAPVGLVERPRRAGLQGRLAPDGTLLGHPLPSPLWPLPTSPA